MLKMVKIVDFWKMLMVNPIVQLNFYYSLSNVLSYTGSIASNVRLRIIDSVGHARPCKCNDAGCDSYLMQFVAKLLTFLCHEMILSVLLTS